MRLNLDILRHCNFIMYVAITIILPFYPLIYIKVNGRYLAETEGKEYKREYSSK